MSIFPEAKESSIEFLSRLRAGVFDRCSEFSNGEIGAAVDHVNRELGPFFIESGEAGESLWNTGSALVGLGGFFGPSDDAVLRLCASSFRHP